MTEITNTLNVTRIETTISAGGLVNVSLLPTSPIVNVLGSVGSGGGSSSDYLIPYVNAKIDVIVMV